MYLNSDYCYMMYKDHHQNLLREGERSRLLRAAAGDAAQQTRIVRRIAAAVEALIDVLRKRSLPVREVIQ